MARRGPDRRMRSPSDEGGAMRNPPERGPLGPGGVVRSRRPAHRGGGPIGRSDSEGESQLSGEMVDVGIALEPSVAMGRLCAELRGAWNLKPYRGKPAVRNFRGGGWRRGHGSRTEAQPERDGTATGPYRARASAPPDSEASVGRPDRGKHAEHIEVHPHVHRTRTDSHGDPSGMANLSAEEPYALM